MSKVDGSKRENATRSSVWALESLVGRRQLRLGIPDTILFNDGAPQAWLFTSKAGVVMKKRSLRKSSIKERFTRLSTSNPNNPQQRVATIRFLDGTVRDLGRESFKDMMAKFPAAEPGIMSMQCYVQGKGSAGTIYRNSYKVVNDKGLAVTGTSSFTTLAQDQADSPVSTWSEREINLEKSNASFTNAALDSVTLSVVRFLEAEQGRPTRVLEIRCDYVVDVAGQIWLKWIGDATLALVDAAQDLRLADVRDEGPRGRVEFLGTNTALAIQRDFGGAPAPIRRARRSNGARGISFSHLAADISNTVDRATEAVELPRGTIGNGSGGIAGALSRVADASRIGGLVPEPSTLALRIEQHQRQALPDATVSTMTVGVRATEAAAWEARGRAPGDKYYPSSFACAGDYCTIRVLDPREDADDPRKRRRPNASILHDEVSDKDFLTEIATRLFSGQELSALRRDASFRRQIEKGLVVEVEPPTSAATITGEIATDSSPGQGRRRLDPVAGGLKDRDPKKWSEVSWRSVCLARQESGRNAGCNTTTGRKINDPIRQRGRDVPGCSSGIGVEGTGQYGMVSELTAKGGGVGSGAYGGGGSASAGGSGIVGGDKVGASGTTRRAFQETEASAMRQHARKREDQVLAGGAQNFYKSVRVCGSCFTVYALLDRARAVLAQQASLSKIEAAAYDRSGYLDPSTSPLRNGSVSGRRCGPRRRTHVRHEKGFGIAGSRRVDETYEGEEEEDPLSLSSDELGGRAAAQASALKLPARPRSHSDGGPTAQQGRKRALPAGGLAESGLGSEIGAEVGTGGQRRRGQGGHGGICTWRGRLEGSDRSGHMKGPGISSGKKFEDLDDYLRGSAAGAAADRRKRIKLGRFGARDSRGGAGRNRTITADGTDGESSFGVEGYQEDRLFHARIFLAEGDPALAKSTTEMLERAGYMVTVETDGKQALEALIEGAGEWDALVVERDLPVLDGFGITAGLRDCEKARRNRASKVRAAAVQGYGRLSTETRGHGIEKDLNAPSSVPLADEVRHLPIICLTSKASPDDLRSYMAAGMDGCVSKPVEPGPLLNTLRAAVPLHLSPASADGRPLMDGVPDGASFVAPTKGGEFVRGGGGGTTIRAIHGKGLGVLTGSAAAAAEGMVLAGGRKADDSVEGVLQIDADTSVPYCIVGSPPSSGSSGGRYFNLVVCHDLFDNYERTKIILAPVIARYPGAQVLLWNYPGQAFSEWREQQLLNNEYLSTLLQHLLLHLGTRGGGGTGEFDADRPYHLVGFGSGGAVATFHASHFASPSPRSLILLNSFSYVDAYLAGVLHDCMNVFTCAPESRPDLPVYFHARFLFSPAYLGQVSTPLALNIYTAVHNPISVGGRVQLCKGALAHVDTRPVLSEIDVPIICIQSTQNNFVKPLHTDPYVSRRGGEVRSIHKALHDPGKTCVVWINAGHEIFQEARAQTTTLLEQAIAGYHESNDVVYAMSHPEFATSIKNNNDKITIGGNNVHAAKSHVSHETGAGQASPLERGGGGEGKKAVGRGGKFSKGRESGRAYEDDYIDSVLRTMGDMKMEAQHRARGKALRTDTQAGGLRGRGGGSFVASEAGSSKNRGGDGDSGADQTETGSAWDGSVGEIYGSSWEQYRSNMAAADANAAARGGGGRCCGSDDDELRWQSPGGGGGPRGGARRQRVGGGREGGNREEGAAGRNIMVGTVLDASHPAFERQDNLVYGFGHGSKVYPKPEEFPEVKEYMTWRLKRNRRRLVRLDRAARRIQGALRGFLAFKRAQTMREERACVYIQRTFRGWCGRLMFLEKLRSVWAAQVVQRNWRGHASRRWFELLRRQQAACGHIQRVWRGAIARRRVRVTRNTRHHAAALMQALWRGVSGRRRAFRCREERYAAVAIQCVFRGHTGRRRAGRERDKFLFSKSQSQGIEFGRQMLLEHKLHATRLQSDVQLLTGEKVSAEESVEAMMEEISEFEEAVTVLEREMHQLSKIETEAVGVLDEEARLELREQKVRLDKEFVEMLGKIADRKDRLHHMEKKLATLDRTRLGKEEELRTLERKLVVLLEEQQRELESIRRRQEKKGVLLLKASAADDSGGGAGGTFGSVGGGGPSAKDKRQAAQLMQSTETLMKFGFMSMSMTYFSSLNMIRAMRSVGASDTVMAALAHNSNIAEARSQASGGGGGGSAGGGGDDSRALALEQNEKLGTEPFRPALKPGQLPGQEPLAVSAWSVDDVARWLQTLTLTQYQEAFIAAAVDGAFLYDLNDDDLKSSLGVEHRLHRKKILNSIIRLKGAESERTRPTALNAAVSSRHLALSTTPGSPETLQDLTFGQSVLGSAAEAVGRLGTADGGGAGGTPNAVPINFKELVVLTRRGKYKQIREILEPLPEQRFDPNIVRVPYVQDYGTAYVKAYEQEPFNLNKVDDHGNSLLMVAAQNGNIKMAKLFVQKGANPNHQNKQGHTAGHYAISYLFFDLSEWLFLKDGNGAGADDTVENKFGHGPYDGLQDDQGSVEQPLMLEGGG